MASLSTADFSGVQAPLAWQFLTVARVRVPQEQGATLRGSMFKELLGYPSAIVAWWVLFGRALIVFSDFCQALINHGFTLLGRNPLLN
jgi:hypothetical protein